MRKLFTVLGVICTILGLILTILPTEKLGLIAIVLGLVFSFLAINNSEIGQKTLPKFILIFSIILIFVALAKTFLIKDEVIIDKKDEIQKIESQKEDKKDLEELDGL